MDNNDIFQPIQIAEIKLNNRILRSATEEGLADEQGHSTEDLIKKYKALAKGGIGGSITSFIALTGTS